MLTATKAKVVPGKLLIDGKWSEGSGKTFDTFNPPREKCLLRSLKAASAAWTRQ